jgi:hypothetical protein
MLVVALAGCSDATPVAVVDAGGSPLDVGVLADAALPTPDAAEPDAAEPDAAKPDAAEPDAAEPDAAEPDAAEPDAAEPDAAEPDAAVDAALMPDAAPVPAAYGPWSAWGACDGAQSHRTRACLQPEQGAVDCAECGGLCAEAQPCAIDCAPLGANVVDCSPQVPGNEPACTNVLVGAEARCVAAGCHWQGPDACVIGGSASNANCFGGTGLCSDAPAAVCAEMGVNVVDCSPQAPGNQPACTNVLAGAEGRCLAAGCFWQGPEACEIGGSVSSANCFGGTGLCSDAPPAPVACDQFGINVVNCNPNVPGDQAACTGVLAGAQARCVENGCFWNGPDACEIGGSVSNAACFGGMGQCQDAAPVVAYGPWGAWSDCIGGQRARERACIEAGAGPVDCALCGGVCGETEACFDLCDQTYNVVNCNPAPPGDLAGCSAAIQGRADACDAAGCVWDGPRICAVGGSPSNAACFGAMGACRR